MIATFAQRFGVEIINYFGSNEGAAMCGCAADIPDTADRATLFPRPGVPGRDGWSEPINNIVQTRLVSVDHGTDITQPGEPGELRIAGPTVFSAYFRAPELSERAFDPQGFFKTGDLFEIAADGQYLRYVGRLKDLVVRGGMKISAEEVETLITSHSAVAEVAVIGLPDAELGEILCACVTLHPDGQLTLEDLIAFLRDEKKLAPLQAPQSADACCRPAAQSSRQSPQARVAPASPQRRHKSPGLTMKSSRPRAM